MNDAPTPALADPGDISPSIERAVAKPSVPEKSFALQREAQDRAAADKKAPPATDQQQPTPAGDKVKIGKYEVSEEELGSMMERQAVEDLRKATLPASPADYAAELPEGFELPAGIKEFTFDETDPLLADARAYAHSRGMGQAEFSDLVGLYASAKAREQAQLNAAHAAEVAKLGANGTQRVSALEIWLRAQVGDEIAGQMRSVMATEKIVRGWEILQRKFVSQGGASFSQSGRVAPEANTIPNYDGMTYAQRRQAQDQLAARR